VRRDHVGWLPPVAYAAATSRNLDISVPATLPIATPEFTERVEQSTVVVRRQERVERQQLRIPDGPAPPPQHVEDPDTLTGLHRPSPSSRIRIIGLVVGAH
jgi:hypothetical protein